MQNKDLEEKCSGLNTHLEIARKKIVSYLHGKKVYV